MERKSILSTPKKDTKILDFYKAKRLSFLRPNIRPTHLADFSNEVAIDSFLHAGSSLDAGKSVEAHRVRSILGNLEKWLRTIGAVASSSIRLLDGGTSAGAENQRGRYRFIL